MNEVISEQIVSDEPLETPAQCPPSHRVARRVSTMIIAILILAIVALSVYVSFPH